MLIIGSGSFFADLLSSVVLDFSEDTIVLYNDVNVDYPEYAKRDFRILENEESVIDYFKNIDNRFLIAVGNNTAREKISKKYEQLGGQNITFISSRSVVGKYARISKKGVIILHNTCISNEAEIDEGTIVYIFCGIGHFSKIGKYNFLSSSVIMSNTSIGNYCDIGIGVQFVPGNSLGNNCKVGTGAIITKSYKDNLILAGVPAKIIQHEN